MIFYFSGTGNSEWVSEEIAKRLGDKVFNIADLENIPEIKDEEYIGFIFPIYAWAPASPMMQFIKKLPNVNSYKYAICTCGEDTGTSMKELKRSFNLNSVYSIVLGSNYIIGSDVESEIKIKNKIKVAKEKFDVIADNIKEKKDVYDVNQGMFPHVKTKIISKLFNKYACSSKPFYATDDCISCGLCARMCPAHTIHLEDGKPKWDEKCYSCLRCINNCPKKAIQYGKKTAKRGRYTIKNYLD